jgi:hypothetical protein
MSSPPASPRIYHITHVDNLRGIIDSGGLVSDAEMLARGGPAASIGIGAIKHRRLALPVACHPGLQVGHCVPFYFCPRSIMLYVIHRGNQPSLAYRGGQGPIVHLEAELDEVVRWADEEGRRWAFSLSNAGAAYSQFRGSLARLGDVDWYAVASSHFGNGVCSPSGLPVKEGKQAELLVERDFPWSLVRRIGVASQLIAQRAHEVLLDASHKPTVSVEPSWYF